MKPWDKVTIPDVDWRVFIPDNKYLYFVNISNPAIYPLWEKYKQLNGLPRIYPVSDGERWEFEKCIFRLYAKELKYWFNSYRAAMPPENLEKFKELKKDAAKSKYAAYADYLAGHGK